LTIMAVWLGSRSFPARTSETPMRPWLSMRRLWRTRWACNSSLSDLLTRLRASGKKPLELLETV
jgi:hypothetical protein